MSLPSYQSPHPRPLSLKRKLPPCMALSWCYFQGMVCCLPQIAGWDYFTSSVEIVWWRTWHTISQVLWQAPLIVCSEDCLEMFPRLIKSSGSSELTWKLFILWLQFLQFAAVTQEIENCFSSRHFGLWSSNMLCPRSVLINVLTWLRWRLCLREVKG